MLIQTLRGWWLIAQPVLAQKPVEVGSWLPSVGFTGQKIQRPMITSSAGSRVIIASRTTPTPMARTGPMLLVEFISATRRQSMPTITVEPLAMIAGPARCRRLRHRLVPVVVATQLLAIPGDQ